jgi:hypothetical protein
MRAGQARSKGRQQAADRLDSLRQAVATVILAQDLTLRQAAEAVSIMSDATKILLEGLGGASIPPQSRPAQRGLQAADVRELVERARQDFVKGMPRRYRDLVLKMQADELTEAERSELAELTDQVEQAWADKLQTLARKAGPRVAHEA